MMAMQFDGKVINLTHVQYAEIIYVSRVQAYWDYHATVFFTGGDRLVLKVTNDKDRNNGHKEAQEVLDRFFKKMVEALQER